MVGPADKRGLAVFVRDPDGGLPGVQSGNTGWGWLHGEKSLWMRGGRGQGLTRRLLGLTEHEAMARGMQRGVAGHVQPGCAAYL